MSVSINKTARGFEARVTTVVDANYTSLETFLDEVKRASEGLDRVIVDMESIADYYDSRTLEFQVTGYRRATEDEKTAFLAGERTREESQRAWQEQQAAQLKAVRPDLFE